MKILPVSIIFGSALIVPFSSADDIVVSSAAVTQVNMVDPGFRTFVHQPLAAAVTKSINPGDSASVEVFQLYTDESKVNDLSDPNSPDDHIRKAIRATVTLGAPVNQTLTFEGETYGDENAGLLPAHLQPILDNPNPTPAEGFLLLNWGLANPGLVGIVGGRGHVEWTTNAIPIDLGGGKTLTVELEDAIYNDGLQINGSGVGNAGPVMAKLTLTQKVEKPKVTFVFLEGNNIKFTMQTKIGYTYVVEKRGSANWEMVGGITAGNGQVVEFTVPKDGGKRDELVRVRETKNP